MYDGIDGIAVSSFLAQKSAWFYGIIVGRFQSKQTQKNKRKNKSYNDRNHSSNVEPAFNLR
jgi:hypothetical protein